MAETMTYSEIMENETVRKGMDEMKAALEADPVTMKLLDAAKNVEDMYEVAKKYMQLKFEDFKKAFHMTVDYFFAPKEALADEVLDNVAGGSFFFRDLFNSLSKKAQCIAGCIAGGLIILGGAAVGAAGVAFGGVLGAVAGAAVLGGSVYAASQIWKDSINGLRES